MTFTRTPAAATPVSLGDAKQHLRVLHDDEDLHVQRLIDAAAREVESYCDLALTTQTITLHVTAEGGDEIPLPVGPLAPGANVTVDGAALVNGITGGRWPVLLLPDWMTGPVRVTYEAGFGPTSAHVPADLQLAIMEQVAFAYDNRGAVDVRPGLTPAAARICARYRRVRA